jgi:ABC-type transport system involved in multi-copper enzyme maturation permease subunit
MSTKTTPDAPGGYHSPFGQEMAPSALRQDEPSAARLIGMIGLCAVVVGIAVVAMNIWAASQQKAPRLIPEWVGYLAIMAGVASMLFHAARDTDIQIRRTYGAAGALLVLLGIAMAFVPFGEQVGGWFLPASVPAFLLGLFFLLPFARNEDDPSWRRNVVVGVTVVGAALALVGLVGGNLRSNFLLPVGALAGLIGLIYLWAAVGLIGTGRDFGYRLAQALGVLGCLVIVAAIVRAATTSHYLVPDGLVLIGLGALYLLLSIGICSERQLIVLARRELAAYFYSPIAYLVLFGMSVICWLSYWLFLSELVRVQGFGAMAEPQPIPEPILRFYFVNLLPVVAMLFVVPAMTMRLLSEEQRTGTMEVMLTAPINEPTVVLSKFFGGLFFFLVMCLPFVLFLIPLRVEGGRPFDVLPLISFLLALLCSGAAFIAIGLFFSSLTRNQIVAAVLTFMAMIVLLVLYFIVERNLLGSTGNAVVRQLSFINLWLDSLAGKLYLRDLIGQVSLAVFFLFLTVKVLEARRWK